MPGVTSGAVVGLNGAGCSTSTCDFGRLDVDAVYLAVNMLNTITTAANVHVNFSRKSVVFLTPIIWLDDENPLAKPPPLDFCTNTANIISIDASRIRIMMKIYISIYV